MLPGLISSTLDTRRGQLAVLTPEQGRRSETGRTGALEGARTQSRTKVPAADAGSGPMTRTGDHHQGPTLLRPGGHQAMSAGDITPRNTTHDLCLCFSTHRWSRNTGKGRGIQRPRRILRPRPGVPRHRRAAEDLHPARNPCALPKLLCPPRAHGLRSEAARAQPAVHPASTSWGPPIASPRNNHIARKHDRVHE